ncbi:terminase large subunit domain-containing protein [Pseudoalteromonas luteoviolacea]|uniref:terminase large subunit domain-containing protein n=1 Tax=Pseudoalteromonas luteoviolacea TaxID=43657 RepID=UPI001B36970D|nr:terminase family protein [Pseudoalteromonas luteoviolacea]MBQ4836789.1 terminase family protein [Pseudoalteromonas luteoviolacea]
MQPKYGPEVRKLAQDLYVVQGYTFDEIAEQPDMPSARSIRRWADDGKWADMCPSYSAEMAYSRKINLLVEKPHKTESDYKELDFCTRQLAVLNKSKLSPAPKQRANNESSERKTKSKKKKKNDCSHITKEMLDELKEKLLYPHQKHWFENQEHRKRFILKPRQIGATFYFAFEAFYDAVVNCRNKIFISASRDQAEIFKSNIIAFAFEHFDVELSGSPMVLTVGGKKVKLIFKSTNAHTAQSESGDLYIDEVFWIPKFAKLRSLASAMATHSHWRITYFSTPSVTTHEAYDFWNGKWFRKTMACNDPEFEVNVKHCNLKHGKVCADGFWRQMLTVYDVVESGFDKINIEILKGEYSKDEFENLFMCIFIDNSHSAFNLRKLLACSVNSDNWKDFDPNAERPYGFKPVVMGFDPARYGDKSIVVILSKPMNAAEKFRLLEVIDLTGNDFEQMANEIHKLTKIYQVDHIGVDKTGMGMGVAELVSNHNHNVQQLHLNPDLKNHLVTKTINVIENKRFEFDSNTIGVAQSFINVRREVRGDNVVYATNRSASIGHGDVAWAIMFALYDEPLDGNSINKQTSVGMAA